MIISASHGMALVRIGFGLYFVSHALEKTTRGWLTDAGPLEEFLQRGLPRAEPVYRPFLEGTVLPNSALFAQLVVLGEWVAGICLTLGILTRLGALTSMWLVGNFMLFKGMLNGMGSNDRLFFLASLAIALTAAGLTWGFDGALRRGLAGNPITAWLAGVSREERLRIPEAERILVAAHE